MDWQPIETAPMDGTVITVLAGWGVLGGISYEGQANWRSENRECLLDPLTGKMFADRRVNMGWMKMDSQYRVPGNVLRWKPI